MKPLEPFDVDYLSDKKSDIPQLSDSEIIWCSKVGAAETMLKAARIPFTYDAVGTFIISKDNGCECPVVRFLDVYDDCYVFSREGKDLKEGKISEVMDYVISWWRK